MQDTPLSSGVQGQCFTPISPMTDDLFWLRSAIDALDPDCPIEGIQELGYALGWVAHKYADFTKPSNGTVSRHLLFTVDDDIRFGNFAPEYSEAMLRCDNGIQPVSLRWVGDKLRDAKVRSQTFIAVACTPHPLRS